MLNPAVTPEIGAKLDVGPMPRGGDNYNVDATGGTENQASGGSLKVIADLDGWDNPVAPNNAGQSGDPANRHYRDLFQARSRGKYFPVFYSRPKIEWVTESKTVMQPAAAPTSARR